MGHEILKDGSSLDAVVGSVRAIEEIAIDKDGNISLPFNTAGMYRGYVDSTGLAVIKIENRVSFH